MQEPRLLLAQAAFFLRRGDTARAVEYYLDALDLEPNNKIAQKALEFIKEHGESESITLLVETGKIKRFYPPLGVHPAIKKIIVLAALASILCIAGFVLLPTRRIESNARADLSLLMLTEDEAKNAIELNMSDSVYRYILSAKDITTSYSLARQYFQDFRDNASQVEINRILNANAALSIRQKARLLMNYFSEPTFDSLVDNYSYRVVAADPYLYQDCFVSWSGRIANVRMQENTLQCDLFVGYDTLQTVEGIVPLVFDTVIDMDPSLPVRVLGRIVFQDKTIALRVKSVYQPLPAK
jgi:hypothetical protein